MENVNKGLKTATKPFKGNQMRRQKLKTYGFYFSVAILPVLQFLIFYIGVNFNSILLALKTYDPITLEVSEFGITNFSNFQKIFDNLKGELLLPLGDLADPIKNSFLAFFWTTIISLPCGLLFSYYIFKKMPMHNFFKIVLFVPSIVSSIVMTMIFRAVVNVAIPSYVKLIFGVEMQPLLLADDLFPIIIFYNIWIGFGTQILMYVSAMSGISESVIEAAEIDGANIWKEFIYVVFPSVYQTFVVFMTVHIASIFINQLTLFPFYGKNAKGPIRTIGYYLYVGAQAGRRADYPLYSAIGLLATVLTLPVVFASKWALTKFGPSED